MVSNHNQKSTSALQAPNEIPAAFRDLKRFVGELMNNTDDTNDSDGDHLPDSVELVIGTDPFNPDSDFDRLSDYQEVVMGLDPNKADSNDDGLSDYVEVTDVAPDADGDGVPNAWDSDNDNDGVPDSLDYSPFAKTTVKSSFDLDITTSGKPTYITFELRTKNPDHMRLIQQSWDWPSDSQGSFKDLDGSTSDVVIMPSLKIVSDNLPTQGQVIDYGIVIDGSSAYLPLFPVWDFGNMVALKGRMFMPHDAAPVTTSLNVSLMWRVSGITDTETRAFATPGGAYFSVRPEGEVLASGSSAGINETFSWTPLGSNKAALRAANGLFMALQPNGTVYASSSEMTSECQFKFASSEGPGVTILASNGKHVVAAADGRLSATGSEVGGTRTFTEVNLGIASSTMGLATYFEDFMLTGMTVEENHGSSIGVFRGSDSDQLMAANLLLAYGFLRNASNNLTDAPELLSDRGVDGILSDIRSFEHQDQAVQASISTMIPAAVDAVPLGKTLPIIVGLQDSFAGMDLSETSSHFIINGPLSFDLTSEPVVVSKVLRSSWYQGGSETPLELYQVIDQVRSWGMSDSSLETAVGLVSAWYCGEQIVASVGGVAVDHTVPEVVFVDDTLEGILTRGIDAIGHLMNVVKVLDSAYAFSETFARMGTLTKAAGQSTWNLFKTTFNSVKQGLTSGTKLFERLGNVMDVIAVVIAVALSLYALFAIGEELGWGAVGTGIAVTYAVVTLAYSIALVVLSSIAPPYGAILAAVIAIIDVLAQLLFNFDFLGKFIGWLVDCFTDARTRSDVSLAYVGSDMTFADVDNNGIDVGDNITYTSRLYGNVTITGDGSWQDLVDSYITPHQVLTAPWGSRSVGGGSTVAESTTYTSAQKTVLYKTQAWLRPGIGMVNFPVAVGLYSDYKVYYDDCWWFFGWWCDRKSQSNDPANTQVAQWTTIYFDVMPGSIDDFYNWRAIPSMDSDGDGLNNSAEAAAHTDPWSWDTDADGLGDKYELQIGTDPTNADTDGDGLNDRFEVERGFNPTNPDTDGDKLKDYIEYRGWAVDIMYRGHNYSWMVNSEPDIADTDNDGVSDYDEYFSLLNPRSADTDGDGVPDAALNYYVTKIEYDSTLSPPIETFNPHQLAVDRDGMIYTISGWDTPDVVILNPNGTVAGGFQLGQRAGDIDALKVDIQGQPTTLVFITHDQTIQIYSVDGTRLGLVYIGDVESPGDNGFWSVALDPNGPEPGTYYLYTICRLSHVHKLLMNGTIMESVAATWGGYGDGPGQLKMPYYGLIDVGQDGKVYVWDDGNSRVDEFGPDGDFVTMWGEHGYQDGQFDNMRSIAVDADGNLLTFDAGGDVADRIQKFDPDGKWLFTLEGDAWGVSMDVDSSNYIYISDWHSITKWKNTYEPLNPEPEPKLVDTDSDGLTDIQEAAGWNITVKSKHGTLTSAVTSDQLAPDTDFDGVSDANESRLGSDPRSVDTDNDRLTDLEEIRFGTNLTNWDTDGDGLGDGQEVKFGSNPLDPDSDHEGLSDYQEFVVGSDPNNNDTDQDGLDDFKEVGYGSDPKNPDSDHDFMLDGQEYALGADPKTADSDSDGINDGYEMLYGTNATTGDSDGDHISDGFEVSSLMSPLSNDTDGDGVNDSRELELGLNPRSSDSDGDGVPDSLDKDYQIKLDGEVVLVYDDPQASAAFASELASNATVRIVSVAELMASYSHARYIVIVGDPLSPSGTAGGLIHQLLQDSGDVLERMTTSDYERMAVRYGLWNETQTIVMLSHVYSSDAIRVIGVLKSMRMSVSQGCVLVDYLNPRACFRLDQIDTTRVTDTFVWGWLGNMTTFSVKVDKLNDTQVSPSLSDSAALSAGEVSMGKYVRIAFQPHDLSSTAIVLGALVRIYYTAADLDLNGDGSTNGSEDLNEANLELFVLSPNGDWIRLSDIVGTTGANTTNVELFGMSYEGYLWANVSSLFMFGIAGPTNQAPPTPDELYDGLREIICHYRDNGTINKGQANSLLQKLDASQARWQEKGSTIAATNILEAFVKEIAAMVRSGVLTGDEGDLLVMKANEIIAAIQPS